MAGSEGPRQLLQRIKSGPLDDDGTFMWMVGMWVWWRTWAMMGLISSGVIALYVIEVYAPSFSNPFVGMLIGMVLGAKFVGVSPKYNVPRNY